MFRLIRANVIKHSIIEKSHHTSKLIGFSYEIFLVKRTENVFLKDN